MSENTVSTKTYVRVWVSLLILLGVTVGAAYVHLGWFNIAAAVTVAVLKAVIIILYFMHVRHSPKVVWIFVGAGFFWLGIIFVGTLTEYFTRAYMPMPTVWSP